MGSWSADVSTRLEAQGLAGLKAMFSACMLLGPHHRTCSVSSLPCLEWLCLEWNRRGRRWRHLFQSQMRTVYRTMLGKSFTNGATYADKHARISSSQFLENRWCPTTCKRKREVTENENTSSSKAIADCTDAYQGVPFHSSALWRGTA